MLEVTRPTFEVPSTWREIYATARKNQAGARQNFWQYRLMIDPFIIAGWWQKHAARELQQFYEDIVAGKRPKLVLLAPPQHGKSRMVTDFITWAAGKKLQTQYDLRVILG